jgi:two-component system, LuxR family, response regulator FixJ
MTQPSRQRTVYLVDDNAQLRSSAQWWLAGAGYAVRDFDDPQVALEALRRLVDDEPDALRHACLLLDVRMPGMSGLDLHDQLAASGITLAPSVEASTSTSQTALPVVYMTGHGDVPLAVSAMQKGAVTMLEKPFAENALEAALERAFAAAESASARAQMLAAAAQAPSTGAVLASQSDASAPSHGRAEFERRVNSLSPRQQQVFQGVVAGKLSKQIAYECGLSAKTVEFHRKAVMTKLQARNAIDLLRMAMSRSVEAHLTEAS